MRLKRVVDDSCNTTHLQSVVDFHRAGPRPVARDDRRRSDGVPHCAYCQSSRVSPSRVRWYDYWQGPLHGDVPFRCHSCQRRFWLARISGEDRRAPRPDQARPADAELPAL
jgi:hypothetical protein